MNEHRTTSFDRAGRPVSMSQWFWLGMGGDPDGGPDALREARTGDRLGTLDIAEGVQLLNDALDLATSGPDGGSLFDPARVEAYKRVAYDEVGPYGVSTVWIGLDASTHREKPLIFETMVFSHAQRDDENEEGFLPVSGDRYATEAEAVEGHHSIVTSVRATCMTDEEAVENFERDSPLNRPDPERSAEFGSED